MFPGGLNPRQMKQMMKRMGIKTEEIDANTVIIQGSEREIIIEGPEVMKMVVQGQEIFNITGGKMWKWFPTRPTSAEKRQEMLWKNPRGI